MDYGKLAYLKAVDLEDRMNVARKNNFNVIISELKEVKSGESFVADISGYGEIAVFANSSDFATFYADGVKICDGNDVFFKLSGGGRITVVSDGIAKLRLMAVGDVISSEGSGRVYADCSEEYIAYLICDQGKIKAYKSQLNSFEPILVFEGDYIQGDLCFFDGELILAVVDSKGDINVISESGKRWTYKAGASQVAITCYEQTLCYAYLKDGQIYTFELNFVDAPISESKVAFSGAVDDVRYVKNGHALLFSSGGKCYVKDFGASRKRKEKLYISFKAEIV